MASRTASGEASRCGFTLVELLVVLAIVATLLSIVAPRYVDATDRAREASLRNNLKVIREAIDHFHGDRGTYPETLDQLVRYRYLRAIPVDPITGSSDDWRTVSGPSDASTPAENTGSGAPPRTPGIQDVRSAAEGTTRDGIPYGQL